ncbi:hypothetical protein K9N68_36865 (plasmid) [Kovacikia minuta CCNUW1]|uniref:hypothetical protein n=1 Tax=Kovacikia minuta TaxID=2931930 RepID=UPI001CCCDE25|nr:hypothetical protein [Kovacikia minuta]UBF29801.1 hypothetical protein K9N68_36865 [Kovacikia minuta CCNUW1]
MRRIKGWLIMLTISGLAIAPLLQPFLIEFAYGQVNQQGSLAALQDIFRPRRRPGGTRGSICLITPGLRPESASLSALPSVMSDRPLLIWQKPITRVEIRHAKTNTVIWSQSLPPKSQRIRYQGNPLQPGQTYQVIAFGRYNAPLNGGEDAQFVLVNVNQRDQIIRELAATEAKLKQQNQSKESIAIAQATLLVNRSLLSDAYQLLDDLPQRSPELAAFLSQLSDRVCGK